MKKSNIVTRPVCGTISQKAKAIYMNSVSTALGEACYIPTEVADAMRSLGDQFPGSYSGMMAEIRLSGMRISTSAEEISCIQYNGLTSPGSLLLTSSKPRYICRQSSVINYARTRLESTGFNGRAEKTIQNLERKLLHRIDPTKSQKDGS